MALIYVITNNINGMQYVGATERSLKTRFSEHCSDSKKQRCKNRPLYIDMNKYGIDNFSIEELEECSDEDKFSKEYYWIEKLDTFNKGYNSTYGGAGKNYFDYKDIADKYSEIQNQKEVAKLFDCDIYTVRIACEKNNIETVSSQDMQRNLKSKKVLMLDKNTLDILREFKSITEATLYLGKGKGGIRHICAVCKGKRKTAYGYKWRYVEDEYISDEFENKAI